MLRIFILSIAALLVFIITVIIYLPAVYVSHLADEKSQGRYALEDVRGTVWEGSAILVSSSDQNGIRLPYLPGRIVWHISPMLLLGQVAMQIENAETLTETIKINGNWNQWRIHPSGLRLRAEQLALLGPPFNTLKLSGDLLMSWQELQVSLQDQQIGIMGIMQMDFKKIASALSPVKPLGEYQLKISCLRSYANVQLLTLRGPLQLQGQGIFYQGHLKFSGEAFADAGQEKQLSLLLNLLGRPKRDGNPNHIALEFK